MYQKGKDKRMIKLTKQQYKAIAEIFKHNFELDWSSDTVRFQETVEDLADYFAKDNPQFDQDKFLEACGL